MVSFKGVRRRLYCTPLDVRQASNLIKKLDSKVVGAPNDAGDPLAGELITDSEIESFILRIDGMIRARLAPNYSEGDFVQSPSLSSAPVPSQSIQVSEDQIRLLGVTVGASATTEQWTLIFTVGSDNASNFTLWGSFSGFQGTGTLSANFLSDDEDIAIPATSWYRNPTDMEFSEGDKIYFSTYDINPTIVYISSQITCAAVLRSRLTGVAPNEAKFINDIEKDAQKLLNDLAEGKIELKDSVHELPADAYAYQVTSYGTLASSRLKITGSEVESGTYTGESFDR